jgi:hypothetical protein
MIFALIPVYSSMMIYCVGREGSKPFVPANERRGNWSMRKELTSQ